MAEKKALYGQALDDALAKGVRSVYENEKLRSLLGGARDKFLSVYDPVAAKITQAGAYQDPFFKKSLLKGLTPETPAADRETVKSITEDLIPYQKNPDYTALERLQLHFDAARAELGLLGETLFGDARRAGEKLNSGKTFEELTEEEKSGVRYFGLDIATLGIPVAKPLQAGKALATGPYNIMADIVTPNRFRTSAGGPRKTDDLLKYDEKPPKDISEVEVKTNQQQIDESIDKLSSNPTIKEVEEQVNIEMKEKNYPGVSRASTQIDLTKMSQKERLNLKNNVSDDDFQEILKYSKNKMLPSMNPKTIFKGDDGSINVKIQGTGDIIPIEDANLRFTSNGALGFSKKKEIQNLNPKAEFNEEGKRIYQINNKTYTEDQLNFKENGKTYRDIESIKTNAKTYSDQTKFKNNFDKYLKDNPDWMNRYLSKRNEKGFMKDSAEEINKYLEKPLTAGSIQRLISKNYGKKELKGGRDPFASQMATAFKTQSGDVGFEIGRSSNRAEFKKIEDALDFFESQRINTRLQTKKGMPLEGPQQAINFLNEARGGLNTIMKQPEIKKELIAQLGDDYLPFKFDKSHADRTLSPSDEVSQFQGMDVYDVKILESQVNAVLQPDLEQALSKYIRNKNVKGSKRIINMMNEYSIGTRMNTPYKSQELTLGDKKWAEENGLITIPMIEKTGAASNIKDYDNVVFGTLDQPSPQKIIEDGIKVRKDYLSAKKKFETENKKGKFWMKLNKGGIVDAADVQYAAPGGFFSKMFGKPAPYMKEEIAKTDIFSPTIKQKATLQALGPEATAVNPGQVFYSNMELSLSKANSPVKFDSEKEFYDYINAAGIGRDEVGDARIGPYISAKAKAGEPILSEDIIKITNESPLNQLTTDGYGFRSEKINVAKRDESAGYDSAAITRGDPQYKSPKYSGTGLMPGYLPNTYRERVLQIDSDKFRGDPGSLADPAARNHSFGDNYTIAWGRSTDRPAIINEGEIVDKATGTIINPLAVTDTKKLQEIEGKIQGLVDDPLTNIKEDDFEGISQAVKALVDKSGGRLPYDKAKKAVDAQIIQKNKQLKKLQSQFVEEEKRLKSIVDMKPQNITMTFIDEIQSDIAQAATRKSRELAAKLEVMAEQGISFDAMQEGVNRDLLQFFADNQSVARPVGATKLELMPQYEELIAFQKQFGDMGKKRPYELTTQDFAMYDNFKVRQAEIIDSMTEEINDKLMKALYPDVPLKDRGAWSDAVLKQHLYEAAHRLFVEKDPRAPTHLGVASGDIVAQRAYGQSGSTATDIAERTTDKQNRMDRYKDALRGDINTPESIGSSKLPGVGTHEFYGGPNSKAWNEEAGAVGGHYTSDIERSMRKYAEDNNSKMIIANVAVSDSRGGTVYNIINQETAEIMGTGDTYRQAESIANDLVDNAGGRYEIKKATDKKFDTEPVFSIPLTKEMLQLNKIYK